jgi:hypothetical protein
MPNNQKPMNPGSQPSTKPNIGGKQPLPGAEKAGQKDTHGVPGNRSDPGKGSKTER